MPQFDKITFLTQIFWLIFIFLVLYLDLLKNFLSEISAVLKIRKKKIVSDTSLVENLNEKSSLVQTTRKLFFFNFVENMKNSILNINETSSVWLNNSLFSMNNSNLKKSHSNFVSAYFLSLKNSLN